MSGKRGSRRPATALPEAPSHQGGTVGLFVSILVRYPEVASVTYRRESHSLKFSILVKFSLPEDRLNTLRDVLDKSIRVYCHLVKRQVRLFELKVKARQAVSVIEMWRDVDSLTQNELSMVLTVVRQYFGDELVVDQIPSVEGDELAAQEEIIEEMLEDLRDSPHHPSLIAFREEGRVLVFNR